jgi:hypothetical protein
MWQTALQTGLTTGLSPAQQVDISQYYGPETNQKQDNTLYYILGAVVLLSVGFTIYMVVKK